MISGSPVVMSCCRKSLSRLVRRETINQMIFQTKSGPSLSTCHSENLERRAELPGLSWRPAHERRHPRTCIRTHIEWAVLGMGQGSAKNFFVSSRNVSSWS
jgi:hypothetical protein